MITAAYLRRSSVSGDRPGDASRETQEAAVRRLCGDDVVLYVDWGITGSGKRVRPEYERLKADIVAGKVSSVCAYSLSRLGRSTVELLTFIQSCTDRGVTVRTAVESLDTSGAMGKLLLTIMAGVASFESDIASERQSAAREAIATRHAAAGLPVPAQTPVYGKRAVRNPAGLRILEDDAERSIEPIIAAWREGGSLRKTTALLAERGIPSPFGKPVWTMKALSRVLSWYAEREPGRGIEMPDKGPGGRRIAPGARMLLQGLLVCHCGARMSPNRTKHAYYCWRGHTASVAQHGRWLAFEKKLLEVLRPAAERWSPRLVATFKNASEVARDRIERRMAVLDDQREVGRIDGPTYKARITELQTELARLGTTERSIATLRMESAPQWDNVPAMNAHLRRLWTSVRLDHDMRPTIEWAVPEPPSDEDYAAEEARQDRERTE